MLKGYDKIWKSKFNHRMHRHIDLDYIVIGIAQSLSLSW